jgi:hypothetical protein
MTSLRPVQAYNSAVVARDIFATPNSLKFQVGQKPKSPFSNIRAVTSKLYSQSRPITAEHHLLPRSGALKSP